MVTLARSGQRSNGSGSVQLQEGCHTNLFPRARLRLGCSRKQSDPDVTLGETGVAAKGSDISTARLYRMKGPTPNPPYREGRRPKSQKGLPDPVVPEGGIAVLSLCQPLSGLIPRLSNLAGSRTLLQPSAAKDRCLRPHISLRCTLLLERPSDVLALEPFKQLKAMTTNEL